MGIDISLYSLRLVARGTIPKAGRKNGKTCKKVTEGYV